MERNKVRKFGKRSPAHATAADGFMVGGAIMAPPSGQIGLNTLGDSKRPQMVERSLAMVKSFMI